MRLYDSEVSGNCYKVRLLLSQLKIPYERVEVDIRTRGKRVEQLGEKNPAAKIPILEIGDGRCVAESNAILWYLGNGTKYLPSDSFEQIRVLQWMFFEQNNLESNIALARYWMKILGNPEKFREAMKVRQEGGRVALEVLDRYLARHSFLVGDQYSIADISLYGYTHCAAEGGFDLGRYPHVRDWISRVSGQEGYLGMSEKGMAR